MVSRRRSASGRSVGLLGSGRPSASLSAGLAVAPVGCAAGGTAVLLARGTTGRFVRAPPGAAVADGVAGGDARAAGGTGGDAPIGDDEARGDGSVDGSGASGAEGRTAGGNLRSSSRSPRAVESGGIVTASAPVGGNGSSSGEPAAAPSATINGWVAGCGGPGGDGADVCRKVGASSSSGGDGTTGSDGARGGGGTSGGAGSGVVSPSAFFAEATEAAYTNHLMR